MKKRLANILAVALSAVIFLASCGNDEAEVIPRDELAKIYAEMLLTDQWIINTPNVRLIADTSLVYAPIFERYGYDADDYRKSIGHYMDDPERFARIFRETGEILDARLADLEERKVEILRREQMMSRAEKFRPDIKWESGYRDTVYSEMNMMLELMSADTAAVEMLDTTAVETIDTSAAVVLIDSLKLPAPDMPVRDIQELIDVKDIQKQILIEDEVR